jgi:carbon monoxide dehydrogenase subunit G
MDMKGEFRVPLPQGVVWLALNDPDVLKASIPGCDELIRESDTSFKGRISASVGPVRAKFAGTATLSDIDAPNGYTLTGSGSGGAAGMVKGGATVRLEPAGDETLLRYEANAQVAGKLAQIGSRLVDMAAKKMADDFFGNFVAQLQAGRPVPAAVPTPVQAAPAEAAPPPPLSTGHRAEEKADETVSPTVAPERKAWLVLGLVVAVIVILALRWKGLF